MNRYQDIATIQDRNSRRRKASIIYPIPPLSDSDTYIRTSTVERLDILASKFYGDTTLWWVIAAANGLGKGSLYVPVDIVIRIPDSRSIQVLIERLNTTR
jgi:phage tail protein X